MEHANIILGHGQITEFGFDIMNDGSYHEWKGVFFNKQGQVVSMIFPLLNLVLSSGGGFTRIAFNNPIVTITGEPDFFMIVTQNYAQIVKVPVLSDIPIADEVALTFPAIKARALWQTRSM